MNGARQHWGIVGGGMLGLMLAWRLRQAGHEVTLLEAASEVGGLASAWQLGDCTWDRHYHVILLSDSHTVGLIRALGLESEMRWIETRTGFYTGGRLVSMSNSWEFLKFPPLGLLDKFRLALTIIKASRIRDWKYLEEIPVAAWLKKWSGQRTFEKIWLPLLKAKLGESYRIASAAFIWAIIARMYAARRSGLKKEMFGYVRGGYATILQHFARRLEQDGVEIRLRQRVEKIQPVPEGVQVDTAAGPLRFDQVAVTAAAPAAARLLPDLSPAEKACLNGITYQGIVCASVLLKKPLARYYVTNITDTWVPFTAVIEMTALVDRAEFRGASLVYLPKYVSPDDPMFEESDAAIRERFLNAVARMYPQFHPDDVLAFQISRVRHVFAVTTRNYSRHVPPFATSLPGVWMVNSSQIVNGTLNVNETLLLAEQAAAAILGSSQVATAGPGAMPQ